MPPTSFQQVTPEEFTKLVEAAELLNEAVASLSLCINALTDRVETLEKQLKNLN